jgi:cytochrome P450
VASAPAEVGGQHVAAGDRVVCDVDAAGRDPQAAPPGQAAPHGAAAPHGSGPAAAGLAFGAGIRPCPGPYQALALAAAVIDAVRERCVLQPGTPVTYEAAPTRVPERLEVVLR